MWKPNDLELDLPITKETAYIESLKFVSKNGSLEPKLKF